MSDIKSIIIRTASPAKRAEIRDGQLFGPSETKTIQSALDGDACDIVVVVTGGARHSFSFSGGELQKGDLDLYQALGVSSVLAGVVGAPAEEPAEAAAEEPAEEPEAAPAEEAEEPEAAPAEEAEEPEAAPAEEAEDTKA